MSTNTFTLVLPAGWTRVDLSTRPEEAIAAYRTAILRTVPRAQVPLVESMLDQEWTQRHLRLVEDGAVCLLTCIEGGVLLGQPTILVAPLRPGSGRTPMDLLVGIAATDTSAQVFDVENLVALRTHADSDRTDEVMAGLARALTPGVAPPRPDGGVRYRQRFLRYLVGDPTDDRRWVDIVATIGFVQENADDAPWFAHVIDDIVTTFRWTR
jgi:hypothetical protein